MHASWVCAVALALGVAHGCSEHSDLRRELGPSAAGAGAGAGAAASAARDAAARTEQSDAAASAPRDATAPMQPLDAAVVSQPDSAGTMQQLDAGAQASGSGMPPTAAAPRVVLEGHIENARDLGGIELADGKRVRAGVLFRGPPLADLMPAGCSALALLQLRSVIDLRIESESLLKPDDACALESAQLVAAPLPVPYNVSPQDYIADLDAGDSIARVFQVLGDAGRYPVYFHCTWGRDRTGVVAALILLVLGAGSQAIIDDYSVSLATVGAYPMSLRAALDEVERRGGVEAYLAAAGVTPQELEVLRARAIESPR